MQRIVPNLWFDRTAADAVEFYQAVFPDVRIIETIRYPSAGPLDLHDGFDVDVLSVEFSICGYRFIAINAGDEVELNPAISFRLNFANDARSQLDAVWDMLSDDGHVLIPLGAYSFNARYGWIQDKYGITWQLSLSDSQSARAFIMPSLMFTDPGTHRPMDAISHYTQVFGGAVGDIRCIPSGDGPTTDMILHGDFQILGQWFSAMNSSGIAHGFGFNQGISLMVKCTDQEEIDTYWSRLSDVPEAEISGWCFDKYGISWQIVPANRSELMSKPGWYEKLMSMRKIEIAAFG